LWKSSEAGLFMFNFRTQNSCYVWQPALRCQPLSWYVHFSTRLETLVPVDMEMVNIDTFLRV
jgi:hypothetical protein